MSVQARTPGRMDAAATTRKRTRDIREFFAEIDAAEINMVNEAGRGMIGVWTV